MHRTLRCPLHNLESSLHCNKFIYIYGEVSFDLLISLQEKKEIRKERIEGSEGTEQGSLQLTGEPGNGGSKGFIQMSF